MDLPKAADAAEMYDRAAKRPSCLWLQCRESPCVRYASDFNGNRG